MKSKGFTLTELIAVIVVLSIIIMLAMGAYASIQRSVLEGQYNNIVIEIEQKAEEYAADLGTTDVVYINVDRLIKEGYLQAEDEENIYDPRDKTKMNCYMIHVIFENGEYKAELQEKLENADGSCDVSQVDEWQLSLYCNGEKCNANKWYTGDIKLSIVGLEETTLANSTVEWTSLLGTYVMQGKEISDKTITLTNQQVLNTTYNVTIVTENNETYTISQNIKIDNAKPELVSKSLDVDYQTPQYLELDANDFDGSGLVGYALISENGSCEAANYSNNSRLEVTSAGNFKLCLKDNAGNINSDERIMINRVTFNYNDLSNDEITTLPVYFLDGDTGYRLLIPERNGYKFDIWVNTEGERIYNFESLKNGDVLNATWVVEDVEIPVDKIDKDTVGVVITNRIDMVLVLDVSGSMSGSALVNLQNVANNLINNMSFEVGSTISIVSFENFANIELNAGHNASDAHNIINRLDAGGGTDFASALSTTNRLLSDNNFNKDEVFVIFVSDGYSSSSPGSYDDLVRSKANTVYTIGIGSADEDALREIASPGSYFNASAGLDSLQEIFTKIQEEIREEVTEKSKNGLIELPNLFISTEFPLQLFVNDSEEAFATYNSINDANEVLYYDSVNRKYYLDLVKIDNKYKLGGNINTINFTYYYE